MTKLIIRPESQLPAIEGLHKYIIIGTESLRAFQAKLRAIDKIPEAQAAKAATVMDAQKTSDNVLKAITILGELLAEIEPKYSMGSVEGTDRPHRDKTLPPNMTKKESHQAQTIAAKLGELLAEIEPKYDMGSSKRTDVEATPRRKSRHHRGQQRLRLLG